MDIGQDGSVYSGTSVTDFKCAGHQSIDIPAEGNGPRVEMNYDRLTKIDVAGKHSIHASGVILGAKLENGQRIKCHVTPLAKHQGCIPVVGALPMAPLMYPLTTKKIRGTDIVLDTSKLKGNPSAFLLYLQAIGHADALILKKYRESGYCVEGEATLEPYVVRAALYADPQKLTKWPDKQVEAVARGHGKDPILLFPMFDRSPE